jgi:hypothetical protein
MLRLRRGERILAWTASSDDTWLVATRTELHLVRPPEVETIPWDEIERADWDRDTDRLRVTEVGTFGVTRRVHETTLVQPGNLLAVIRERVTATVLLQRRAEVPGKGGLTVIARRPPEGGPLRWLYEFDPGVDPEDPAVRKVAEAALRAAAAEVGADPGAASEEESAGQSG